jgi:hypothetical protein
VEKALMKWVQKKEIEVLHKQYSAKESFASYLSLILNYLRISNNFCWLIYNNPANNKEEKSH